MRILIACESSGAVRSAFRSKGYDAWSCDLLPADDESAFHISGDCLPVIASGWDLVIAHPPCTHLASSGARHFAAKRADGRQQMGIEFFMAVIRACESYADRWAVENPIGIMSRLYRKPDQIIQPWMFGHPETKATCLWIHDLPALRSTDDVKSTMLGLPPSVRNRIHHMSPGPMRWKERSKTYAGIAQAMADQWGFHMDDAIQGKEAVL